MSRARELSRLGNPNVITADSSNNVGLGTTASIQYKLDVIGDAFFSGVVTATSFGGDGSALTGVAATDNINTNNIAISGIATVGTSITMRDGAINVTGVITATSFEGSGANLTGIAVTSDLNTNNIKVSGISTFGSGASTFPAAVSITASTNSTSTTTGALVVTGGVGIAGSLHVGENVTVGGTVTYEDVTNIDSVGVVTARLGVNVSGGDLKVGSAFTVAQSGVVTATSYYGDGSTLTNAGITAGKAVGLAAFLG